jgi:hypothetical protein
VCRAAGCQGRAAAGLFLRFHGAEGPHARRCP